MLIIPLNLDSVLLFLHNSKLAYWTVRVIKLALVALEWVIFFSI